jgi:DNA-binding IclR family transcriptional regulator
MRTPVCCELLKAVRARARTVQDLAEETGFSLETCRVAVMEFEAHGIVTAEKAPQCGRGVAPMLYRLAPEWRGPA